MKMSISRIGLDFTPARIIGDDVSLHPAIVVGRGGFYDGVVKRYPITSMATLNRIQRITSAGGAIKVDNVNRCMWYPNVAPSDAYYHQDFEFVSLRVTPGWKLEIRINDDGRAFIDNELSSITDSDVARSFHPTYKGRSEWWMDVNPLTKDEMRDNYRERKIMDLEHELMEDALCNGWTLDPDDDGRFFIGMIGTMDDVGVPGGGLDVCPGQLGWYWNMYALRSWVKDLMRDGSVIFDVWYFGETLDDQRSL